MAELTTLARPYAKAAFEVAMAGNDLQTWSDMLGKVAAVVDTDKVASALASPSLTGEQQAQIVIDICGDEMNEKTQNFIRILSENKRLALLSEIVGLFEVLKANQEKTVEVGVSTAFPLEDAVQQKLAASLRSRLQREVNIHSEVDKSLIGGVVIRAGDLVIDGSIRGRLSKLAEAMNS